MNKILKTGISILQVLIVVEVVKLVLSGVVGTVVNCEFCGEKFDSRASQIEEICDSCFGWNEHKASLTDEGILLNFENGEGYYFEGKGK